MSYPFEPFNVAAVTFSAPSDSDDPRFSSAAPYTSSACITIGDASVPDHRGVLLLTKGGLMTIKGEGGVYLDVDWKRLYDKIQYPAVATSGSSEVAVVTSSGGIMRTGIPASDIGRKAVAINPGEVASGVWEKSYTSLGVSGARVVQLLNPSGLVCTEDAALLVSWTASSLKIDFGSTEVTSGWTVIMG